MRDGLGSGTAGNKAATYLLISSNLPGESPSRGNAVPQRTGTGEGQQPAKRGAQKGGRSLAGVKEDMTPSHQSGPMPLNINVQIYISADATGEQIEFIFAAMRRYLYDGARN